MNWEKLLSIEYIYFSKVALTKMILILIVILIPFTLF